MQKDFHYDVIYVLVLLLTLPDRTVLKFIVRKFVSYCLTEASVKQYAMNLRSKLVFDDFFDEVIID